MFTGNLLEIDMDARSTHDCIQRSHERNGMMFDSLEKPRSVLVFRIGQLGDTIVALPAMWAVRKHFPDARLTLLCDRHPGKLRVLAADLLRRAGIFDAFESYDAGDEAGGRFARTWRMFKLLRCLRRGKFDTLVYLSPNIRTQEQVKRDRRFFSAAGIKQFIAMEGFVKLPRKISGQPLGATLSESDLLLARLAADGIPVPGPGEGCMDLKLGEKEESEVRDWLDALPGNGGRTWIAFGPGSKMPAKRWPVERFVEIGKALIESHDIWPVVFGGAEDRKIAEHLLGLWMRGYSAAGQLSLRGAAQALKRCAFYIGNDTGTMHLAAAGGIRCVAIFSARHAPGAWNPYGKNHRVFQTRIECEGCLLVECLERKNECLTRIPVAPVLEACKEIFQQQCLIIN